MELKLWFYWFAHQPGRSSNRTFMELKWDNNADIKATGAGSNRTFMELKFWRLLKMQKI